MRILHVLDHSIPLHSGYAFRSRAILEQQRALGWETVQLTGPKQGPTQGAEEEVDGLRFHRTAPAGGPQAKLPVLGQYAVVQALEARLLEVARATRPDLLHAHSPSLDGLAALHVGRRLGIPVVYEVRAFWEDAAVDHGTSRAGGLRYRLTHALETHVLRRADAVTTICEGLRGAIVARGVPAQRVSVIPNAVDPARFAVDGVKDPALAASLGLGDGPVLGFIGSFYGYEGLSLLLAALPRVLERHPEVRVLLVGGGVQEESLRRQAADLGLSEQVVLTGRVPHDQVARYYDLVDVFVYPRLPMRLTDLVTPLKPLEAMASGRLVVASDVGGHRELIRDRENGYLFRAGDVDDLAATVSSLLADRASWDGLRQAGRRFVETERNWPAVVARYGPIYEGLLNG